MKKSKNSNLLFNFIAPIYGLFYNSQKEHYKKIVNENKAFIDISSYHNIIDVGCGTGALCSALQTTDINVTGVDPAKKMLNIGINKNKNKNITFIKGSTDDGLLFNDKTFDLSIASYVAHGLHYDARIKLYQEMSRITKHFIIIYDYNNVRSFWTNVIEWAEKGDYFYFIKNVLDELNQNFKSVKVVNVDKKAAWYICEPFDKESK